MSRLFESLQRAKMDTAGAGSHGTDQAATIKQVLSVLENQPAPVARQVDEPVDIQQVLAVLEGAPVGAGKNGSTPNTMGRNGTSHGAADDREARLEDDLRRALEGSSVASGSLLNHISHGEPADIRIEKLTIQPSARLAFHTDPNGLAADRLRFLRMRLRELWATGKLRKLLITSPLPKDGKSTIALNLATALAENGNRSVLLIDADLHHSSLARALGLKPELGLSDCVKRGVDPFRVIRRLEPLGWNLLPAGEMLGHPTELLQGELFAKLVERLSSSFDWILFDSPPVLGITDALLVAQQVDAALVVARAGSTPGKAVEDSISRLGRKRVLGVVLNGIEGLDDTYSKYHYSSGTEPS